MNDLLHSITGSFASFIPELILTGLFLIIICCGLFKINHTLLLIATVIGFAVSGIFIFREGFETHRVLFNGMFRLDGTSSFLKILLDFTGIGTCLLSIRRPREYVSEYFSLLLAIILGGHLLVMSTNFLMIFLSIELISISGYVLAGFSFSKTGSEGSLKYFLFGAAASAVMLYGFSILYGLTGTIDFSKPEFVGALMNQHSPLVFVACFMVMAGFLYKIAAAPMHPWAPDVYEGAPIPVIAFLSIAPKIAGFGILLRFVLAVNLFGQSLYDWQVILCAIAILTLTIGNFSALRQQNPKRLMAYSSIAQSGFLLVGIAAFLPQGIQFMLFYISIYMLMNLLVFHYLAFFERKGITTIQAFSGKGKIFIVPIVFLTIGLISLTGLPPTAGFTAKLFIFSALWQAYELTGKSMVLWLLIFGLLNTVISLFYYLRIPYFAFLKSGETAENQNLLCFENLLGLILVVAILILFFLPGLLMGWINKINFVL